MELLLPSSKPLEQLELFQKRILKQILSLPMSCPDPAVYILTGILPIEAQIHIKALTFFNNVCHQGEKNTEKKLARRQLTVKEESSNSWFICQQNTTKIRPERGVQLFGQSYQKITMDLVGEIKSE